MPPRANESVRQILRVLALSKLLRTGRPFSSVTMAEQLGVDARTIKRDLHVLRELGWRISWDLKAKTYSMEWAPNPTL